MLKEALEFLQENLGAATRQCDDDERCVFDRAVFRPPLPTIPRVKTLTVFTLDAFAEYVSENPDGLGADGDRFWVHVETPSRVCLIGPPDENRCREVPVIAECPVQDVTALARFQGPDDLIPALIAMDAQGDRDKLLKMMRTVSRHRYEVIEDNHGGQQVKTESQGGPTSWTPQDNPLSLAPWRTFPEVAQPVGLFVVRWNERGDFKLTASPDERWRLEAVRSVATYLKEKLGERGPVFA